MLFLEKHNILKILSPGSKTGNGIGKKWKIIDLAQPPHFIGRKRI